MKYNYTFLCAYIPPFTQGYKIPNAYIAAQGTHFSHYFQHGVIIMIIFLPGPTNTTVSDFWQMIWDQKCPIIVMLTNIEENGRVCGGEGSLCTTHYF